MANNKKKKPVSVTNIPEMLPPLTATQLRQVALSTDAIQSTGSVQEYINSRSSSGVLDPAEQALLQASESKARRKKEETRIELEKIQERIDYTLSEYQPKSSAETDTHEVDLHTVQSPEELYQLLTDVRLRTKYQQQVTLLLLGHETALEDRERLLQSIQEFFQETEAGNTTQLLDELAAEEIDFDQATAGLESALKTAQSAGERLLEIKKDMGQLFSIVQAFPDTKKGRKKLEKALLKAQEEVESLQNELQKVEGELGGNKEKVSRLQKQVDVKNTECERLKKTASQVEQLQKKNAGLQSEVDRTRDELQRATASLERERQEKLQLLAKRAEVKEVVREAEKADDSDKVKELETAIVTEKEAVQQLKSKMEAREGEFQEEKEALVAEHESEIQEMRSRYEEQMKSLMEDDMFDDMGSVGEGEIGGYGEEGEGGEERVDYDEPYMEEERGGSGLASIEQLKLEHQQREMKLREEMNEVKNKSRKTVTGLKVQLTEAQNRLSDETSSLQKQINTLEREKMDMKSDRGSMSEQIASLEEAVSLLEAQLAETREREVERDSHARQLQSDLEKALAAKLEGAGPERASRLQQLVNRSAQWSEVTPASGLMSPAAQSSIPPFPVLPMEEVPYSCDPSTNHLNPLTFDGGATPQSVLDQSMSSHHNRPLGSPQDTTTAAPYSHTHPQNALHMLAQSRLSYHTPQTTTPLSHDHPVVCEWVKAYDLVMKFRDGMVGMLSEDERFDSEVEDLRSIEGAPMERDQEVQGQVTQMRFSLTLTLHQMEVTLQDSFNKLLGGGGEMGETGEREEDGDAEMKNLKVAHTQLRKKLKQTEDLHKMELQESKETIANLSNKVETLRMEITSLRHSMATPTANEGEGDGLAMFTRLDFDHNKRELESAIDSERLSRGAYQRVEEEMKDYLAIPSQRLAQFGRRRRDRAQAESLVRDVKREFKDKREITERVVEKIRSHDRKKQRQFEEKMESLSVRRKSLARTLTVSLGEVEKETNAILIKPIYGTRAQPKQQTLITHLPRPIPIHKLQSKPQSQSQTRTAEEGAELARDRHSMQLVSRLVASRQETLRGDTESGKVSCVATPLPPSHLPHTRDTMKLGQRREGEWQVDSSRPPEVEGPFSPFMFHAPPAIPRIMELDVNRRRHVADLLGHLLPERQLRSTTPATSTQPQSSAVQSKLVIHTNREPHHSKMSSSRSFSFPQPTTLPPISVPSRINGPLTAIT